MYNAVICKLRNVNKHSNADKLQVAIVCQNQIIVGLENKENEVGVYFPTDGQLSHDFCHNNNLYIDSTLNKDTSKKGYFDNKRRVRTQKFRGEISDGFWLSINCLDYLNTKLNLIEGFEFNNIGSNEICKKYIPISKNNNSTEKIIKIDPYKESIKKMFKEHIDTSYLNMNLNKINNNDLLIITEKLHGTSFRIGNIKTSKNLTWYEKLIQKIFRININNTEYKHISGTRRVILTNIDKKSQYHSPDIRKKVYNTFNDLLKKGETVYGEIVGFEPSGASIMPPIKSDLLKKDKELNINQDTMFYSYGCKNSECEVYVYRITMTNEDGYSIDLSWEDVKKRCTQLNVKHVPELLKIYVDCDDISVERENIFKKCDELTNVDYSTLDGSHIREGICLRIEGGREFNVYKHKSFKFKVFEGLIKDSGILDIEEAGSL